MESQVEGGHTIGVHVGVSQTMDTVARPKTNALKCAQKGSRLHIRAGSHARIGLAGGRVLRSVKAKGPMPVMRSRKCKSQGAIRAVSRYDGSLAKHANVNEKPVESE